MSTENQTLVETAPRTIIVKRVINAPRELVFDAFTKAEHLAAWYGPHGFKAKAESDPRVGGKYRITMIGTDALPPPFSTAEYPMKGQFTEFVRPEGIAYTTDLSDHPDSWKQMFRESIVDADKENFLTGNVVITFDNEDGKTKLTISTKFDSDAVRDAYAKLQMGEGWSMSLEKLEAFLTK